MGNLYCLDTLDVGKAGIQIGFTKAGEISTPDLANIRPKFRPRDEVETDPSLLQLVVYVTIVGTDESNNRWLLTYQRSGTEDRLNGLTSIGVGGHVEYEDYGNCDGSFLNTIGQAAAREVREEVRVSSVLSRHLEQRFFTRGYLYDPTTPVGQVHLGVALQLNCDLLDINEREFKHYWKPLNDLKCEDPGEFEVWSRLLLPYI